MRLLRPRKYVPNSLKPKYDLLKKKLIYTYKPYNFEKQRFQNIVRCDEPLIAIGSVMRSGGNLLNRLFDNHGELRTYHSELLFSVLSDYIVYEPLKAARFPIYKGLTDTDYIFEDLANKNDIYLLSAARKGFVKVNYDNPLPFLYKRKLHKKIFRYLCNKGVSKQRDIFNNYLTGFFNSYIDYQSLYGFRKKYTTVYWPGFVLFQENVDKFFSVYPDGKIISIMRNPLQWAGSAKKRRPAEFNTDYMDSHWLKSAKNSIYFNDKYGDSFVLVEFDDIVRKTRKMMMKLCDKLGLSFESLMTYPTFNGMPIEANSINTENQQLGIVSNILESYEKILTREEIVIVKDRYIKTYKTAIDFALNICDELS